MFLDLCFTEQPSRFPWLSPMLPMTLLLAVLSACAMIYFLFIFIFRRFVMFLLFNYFFMFLVMMRSYLHLNYEGVFFANYNAYK